MEAEAEASGVAPLRYRQFRGMAWPPSAPPPSGTGTLPPSKLVLHHVHGYRGSDCRNNLLFTADGELLYFVAAVGVVHNFDTNTQRFFTAHDDDIVAMRWSDCSWQSGIPIDGGRSKSSRRSGLGVVRMR